ncbi:B1 bradykinin receptor [Hypomesus transpacificus]|uniref:B1 bradykinin receptor n=1 Tax=Hypomesus transpacificus TaxID=137520 RepID=UPI001F086E58|nr:B1 bradykinin receptor [Hypomesus transpacificus]
MESLGLVHTAKTLFENSSALPPPTTTETFLTPEWDLIYAIIPPYLFILSVMGFLGNSFVLLIFLLHRGRWTVPEIYLGNLALADLLLLASLPFWGVTMLFQHNWPFGSFLCKAVNLSVVVNFYTSMYMLAMVSVDRYLALVKTMQAKWLRRTRYAKAVCLGLWVFGVLMGVPTIVHRKVVPWSQTEDFKACQLDYPAHSWKLAQQLLLNVVGFVLPVLVIVFCNLNIVRTLNKRRECVYTPDATDRKATVLVHAVTILFLLCWVPFQFFTFLDSLCDMGLLDEEAWVLTLDIGNQFSTYLAFLNSGLNPVLYVFSGQYFRRKVSAIYRTRQQRRGSDMTAQQRSVISTYLHKTEQIKPARM